MNHLGVLSYNVLLPSSPQHLPPTACVELPAQQPVPPTVLFPPLPAPAAKLSFPQPLLPGQVWIPTQAIRLVLLLATVKTVHS
ncbi:hypothetical protein RRG08_020433 [Elysia crispata]|uniref:Uncharacterized protein n=1 Tax=Elysia crispata TaxID=231223 RepID=A0AAE1B551_9GAST|nr:hypothetical protein RRG08_020433 [Elysia crispata]